MKLHKEEKLGVLQGGNYWHGLSSSYSIEVAEQITDIEQPMIKIKDKKER